MDLESIDPGEISLEEDRFRTTLDLSCSKLTGSIAAVGVLSPPILTIRQDHTIPVTGWKRIASCRELNLSLIPVFINRTRDDLSLIKVALYDNLTSRGLDLVEKAEFAKRLLRFGESRASVIRNWLPLLDIPQTGEYLDRLGSISELDPATKHLIHEKDLPVHVAARLTELTEPQRRLIIPYLETLGRNKQFELLDDLSALSKTRNLSVEDFWASGEVSDILASRGMGQRQKAELLRKRLHELRFPRLEAGKKKFKERLESLNPAARISVTPSPNFEEDAIAFGFSARSAEELRQKAGELNDLAARDGISDLFEVIGND